MPEPLRELRRLTDRLIIGVSGGKDSLVVLDQAVSLGFEVRAYHLYVVPGLEFRERYLAYLERRYGLSILRWPHPDLTRLLRDGVYREPLPAFPLLDFPTLYAALRAELRAEWIANGEKMMDSLQRRGMLNPHAGAHFLDHKRRVAYPLARWNDRQVMNYLKQRRIPLPPDYGRLGHSFGGSVYEVDGLHMLERHYPADFRRYRKFFPAIEAALHHAHAQEIAQTRRRV